MYGQVYKRSLGITALAALLVERGTVGSFGATQCSRETAA
jgi:hypothetical protein